ncbi:unnamed protein product [Urochloa humidicola]
MAWSLAGSDYGGGILVLGEQGDRLSLHSTHSITTGSVAGGSSSSLHMPHFPVVGCCCSKNIKDLIKTKIMREALIYLSHLDHEDTEQQYHLGDDDRLEDPAGHSLDPAVSPGR